MVFKVSSYRVPAGAKDSFSKTVKALIAKTKASPGVVGYRGGFDLDDVEVFTLTGLYDNEQAFDRHLQSDHLKTALRDVKGLTSDGVQFMSAASFDCTEEGNDRKPHVTQLLSETPRYAIAEVNSDGRNK